MRALAVLVLVLSCLCGPTGVRAQSDEALAQRLYREGRDEYDAGRYDEALRRFRGSLDAYDSPNARLYVARSLRELGRLGEAYLEYDLTASSAADLSSYSPRYAETRAAAQREIDALRPRVAFVTIQIHPTAPGLLVAIGERPVTMAALGVRLPVTPGSITVRAEAPGFAPTERTIVLDASEHADVALELSSEEPPGGAAPSSPVAEASTRAPDPPAHEPVVGRGGASPLPGWLGIAGGGAAVIAGAVLAVLADQQYRELVNDCGAAPCPPSRADDVDHGRALDTATAFAFVAGGVLLVAGVAWLLLAAD